MEKAKDPDVIKCFLDWARGLRTCAHQKNIGDSIESYNLMHVPAIWVNALKEAGLAGKFVVDSEITFGRRDDRILLNTKAGPF
jgi:hypothetical protein